LLAVCLLVAAGRQRMVRAASARGVELPILMYHHMLKEQRRLGRYTISPDEFRPDMEHLKQAGFTPIVMKDLFDYVVV